MVKGWKINLGLPQAFQQGRIFIVPYPLWHEASGFAVSFKGPPKFNRLPRQARGTDDLIQPQSPLQFLARNITNEQGSLKLLHNSDIATTFE